MTMPLEVARALYWMTRFAEARPDGGDAPATFLPSGAVSELATELLASDTAGPATIHLSTTANPAWRDIRDPFERMLREHGLAEPLDGRGAVRVIELDVARRILAGDSRFFGITQAWAFLNQFWELLELPTFAVLSWPRDIMEQPRRTGEILRLAAEFVREHG